jgi:DNA processing protein
MVRFGTPKGVFDSYPGEIAELPRMSERKEELIRSSIENADLIRKRIVGYQNRGVGVVAVYEELYPGSLFEIADPPPVLYWKGQLAAVQTNCVAIVGTHTASLEGIAEGVRLGKAIALEGATVVSGLARGIDSAAHLGALQADGTSIAALGCGFDNIYPSENQSLAENLCVKGLLISEYPPETTVTPGRLIARNRLIVGLAKSIIVVEVTQGSGGTTGAIAETLRQGKALYTCFNANRAGTSTNSMGAVHLKNKDDWQMVLKYLV